MYLCAGMCMRECACACVYTDGCRCHWRPEGGADSLQLELQAAGSHLVWVLGTELGSSIRAERVLHCWSTLQSLYNLPSKDRDLVPAPFQGTKESKGYQRGARWVKEMEQKNGATEQSVLQSNKNTKRAAHAERGNVKWYFRTLAFQIIWSWPWLLHN